MGGTARFTCLRYSPIGVCFLIASKLAGTANLGSLFISLGFYMLTVLLGLFIHGFIVIPLIYLIFVRKNPFKYILGIVQAVVTAFATASRYLYAKSKGLSGKLSLYYRLQCCQCLYRCCQCLYRLYQCLYRCCQCLYMLFQCLYRLYQCSYRYYRCK